jgi:hypothetical protein
MLRRKCKYDIKSLFDKMILTSVYNDKILNTDLIKDGKCYVYLIRNELYDFYYIGSTRNLKQRIKDHLKNNTANINTENSKVYILEEPNGEIKMLDMEKLWICWFHINSNFHLTKNISITNCLCIIKGDITNDTINNTTYERMVKENIIIGLTLYDDKQYLKPTEYKTQERKKVEDIEENIRNEIRKKAGFS